jgi:hypothetical protein
MSHKDHPLRNNKVLETAVFRVCTILREKEKEDNYLLELIDIY